MKSTGGFEQAELSPCTFLGKVRRGPDPGPLRGPAKVQGPHPVEIGGVGVYELDSLRKYERERNETMSSVLFATCTGMVEMPLPRLRDHTS